MANYIFETMSQSDAAAFTAGDYLLFSSSAASATTVQVAPYTGSLGASGINLTYGSTTLTFSNALSDASQNAHIVFNDGSGLIIGTTTAGDTLGDTGATAVQVIYGLDGNDTINLGTKADYVYGGTGDDHIGTTTSNGNYHIYGNASGAPVALTSTQTDVDTIVTGTGSSYIQGNAGNDSITVGAAGSHGNNTIFGGADDDTITVHGAGFNHVNGNTGNDTINAADATGNNTLRGGQGNDTITAGHGQDVIMGDVGNDHLIAGTTTTHLTVMTGGAGADIFDFSGGAQGVVPIGTGSAAVNFYQEVTDFTHAVDSIDVGFTVNAVLTQQAGVTFTSVDAAHTYAQQLLTAANHTDDVAAVQVGSDTYLFYTSGGAAAATIDSTVKLDGVTASTLTIGASSSAHDFVVHAGA